MSDPFTFSNGVRQGSILSPYIFNLSIDDLSNKLNACKIGCISGVVLINHLMNTDDVVLVCPYSGGLAIPLNICSKYAIQNDVI